MKVQEHIEEWLKTHPGADEETAQTMRYLLHCLETRGRLSPHDLIVQVTIPEAELRDNPWRARDARIELTEVLIKHMLEKGLVHFGHLQDPLRWQTTFTATIRLTR